MTNEDAVNMIGQLRMYISGGGVIDRKLDEAVQMAIDALKELGNQSQEVNNPNDCIDRQAAIEALANYIHNVDKVYGIGKLLSADDCKDAAKSVLDDLPSVQPEPLSDAYMKTVWTWLLDYQIKVAELKGRYTPYEVLSWVANDWRKEHE